MTDDEPGPFDRVEESRRSVLKMGTLASGALALGGTGSVAAQEDDGVGEESSKALIRNDDFHPLARFTFISGVIEWVPNVPEVEDNVWSEYDTRMIRWLNTNDITAVWVAQNADVGEFNEELGFVVDDVDPQQPQVYEMNRESALFDDSPYLLTVNFSPIGEAEEDDLLQNDDWWQDATG